MSGSSWFPLVARGGELRFGSRAVFAPDGLAVRPRNADPRTLPWEQVARPDGEVGWFFDETRRGDRAVLPRLVVRQHGDRGLVLSPTVPLLFAGRMDAATNLARYLRDTPEARPGLADARRVAALVDGLRDGNWWSAHLPREPLMGDAYDLHWAVERAMTALWPRRYDRRPVAGEPVPEVDALVARVRVEQGEKFAGEEIAARVRPYLHVLPWPFSVLVPETNGPAAR